MTLTDLPTTRRRVVVTGLGAVTPLGVGVQNSWESLLEGRCGIGPITQFDATTFNSRIAGSVPEFNPDDYIPKKEQKKMGRFIQFSLACSDMALSDAGLEIDEALALRTGVIIGVGMGGLPSIEACYDRIKDVGPGRTSPFFIPMVIANLASGQVSIRTGAKGVNYSITSACASGAHSIGEAYRYIRDGMSDVMIAGGAESLICPTGVGGFAAMKALSTRNDDPQKASRPFDKDRDGFVLSEGAGLLVLEDYEHAQKRGAKIYAEVSGYGISSDAYHMANPSPNGRGAAQAIQHALTDAQLNPEQIDYVNAHGTSTPAGDLVESQALEQALGDHAKKVWVSSTKGATGHTLGAAGAIESVFTVLAIQDKKVPPTINLENPGENCTLDYVPNTARDKELNYAINNSFGFGGTNASLIFSKL